MNFIGQQLSVSGDPFLFKFQYSCVDELADLGSFNIKEEKYSKGSFFPPHKVLHC